MTIAVDLGRKATKPTITETLKLQNVDHRNRFKLTVMLVVKMSYGDYLGCGNESLFKWSWSHDQDGRHAHLRQ